MNTKYVIVGGFHASGSSAITDLLREYKGFYEAETEIRFITDPYGIIQLEHTVVEDWDWIRATTAAFDYLDYCRKCARKKTHFPLAQFGMGYKDKINPRFVEISKKYIDSLNDFTYKMDFYALKAKKTYFKYVLDRCLFGIDHYSHSKLKVANMRDCYYIHPSRERFSECTKCYFDELFEPFFDNETKTIILDQAIMPRNADVIDRYFNNAKMVIVERDPRDMFCNEFNIKSHGVTSDIENTEEAGIRFAKLQMALREDLPSSSNILKVKFEDIIIHYDDVVRLIENFFDISSVDHIKPKEYLRPELSIKNIGIWKKYYNQFNLAIDAIEKYMPNDLYTD